MSQSSTYARVPLPLLIGTGAVIFLANAGLLVLQLAGGRFLAPFIGSSVETWTSVIGVFLTGIAAGNWFGGRLADRFPSPRTVAVLLVLSGLSSLAMIGWYEYALESNFYRWIPLRPRIPVMAFMFCFFPALFMSLLTPVTIKLLLPDVSKAGRIAGLIFSLSTLGCLIGNYVTGFWLMAEFSLNTIASGVGLGLIALSIPVLFFRRPEPAGVNAIPSETNSHSGAQETQANTWNFKADIRLAYLVVFLASFCGMSLELAGVRVLAPVLGVSLYTWTGIIGVMLAGTATGNWLGGVLADRGVGPAVARLATLSGALIGGASAPFVARYFRSDFNPLDDPWVDAACRAAGAVAGILVVIPLRMLGRSHQGKLAILASIGGTAGLLLSHTIFRTVSHLLWTQSLRNLQHEPFGSAFLHGAGFAAGAMVTGFFIWDTPKREQRVSGSTALSGSLFLASLFSLAVVMMTGILSFYDLRPGSSPGFMNCGGEVVLKVIAWTFGLFFVPMLFLGTISPQVIRLSVPDMESAGRVAGSIYAWSTAGAIAGTFTTGYFLIGMIGTFRVVMLLAFLLVSLSFVIGKQWKSNGMLFAASIICGGGIFGLFFAGYSPSQFQYTKETKYYAISVDPWGKSLEYRDLTLDHLLHSSVKLDDPTWLYYRHEYVQAELLLSVRRWNATVNALVIGGGGYTFPRYVESEMPDVNVEVVEIDPGVTEVAYSELGLKRDTRIRTHNLDGRQFISERAPKGHYHLVVQDAVNDYSVPYHLLTKEYNDAVKKTLAADGAYLLTLIDPLDKGKLWRAAFHTLRLSFQHVYLLSPEGFYEKLKTKDGVKEVIRSGRNVYIIYASDQPLDLPSPGTVMDIELHNTLGSIVPLAPPFTHLFCAIGLANRRCTQILDGVAVQELLDAQKKIILTDQYCPVDNLMADVFRDREQK